VGQLILQLKRWKSINILHSKNKKGYATINIYARDKDFKDLEKLIDKTWKN